MLVGIPPIERGHWLKWQAHQAARRGRLPDDDRACLIPRLRPSAPRGSGARGIDWRDVEAKFLRLFPLAGLPAGATGACLEAIANLDRADSVGALAGLLSRR